MKLEISTESEDLVHYKVVETSYFHIDDFELTMGEKIWQDLVDEGHKLLLFTFNTVIDKFLPHWFQKKLAHYNEKIETEGPMTFVSKIFGKDLLFNMTMTKYPEFRSSDQMIELHMDGRFVDKLTHQTYGEIN